MRRISPPRLSGIASRAGVLIAALLVAVPAWAQVPGESNRSSIDISPYNANGTHVPGTSTFCGTGTPGSARVSTPQNVTCSGNGFTASVFATAASGLLKWSTDVSASSGTGRATAWGFTEWYDEIVFTGVAPHSVTFDYAMKGISGTSASQQMYNTGDLAACSSNYMQVNLLGTNVTAFPNPGLLSAGNGSLGQNCGSTQAWSLSGSSTAILGSGASSVGLWMWAQGQSYMASGLTGAQWTETPVTGNAFGHFSSTGGITALTFRDANGAVLTNVNYAFTNGTTLYNPNASVVPEPSTWAMLGTGLLMLAAVGRRKRSRTRG